MRCSSGNQLQLVFKCETRHYYSMNWESEKAMARDVEENKELYEALADGDSSSDE